MSLHTSWERRASSLLSTSHEPKRGRRVAEAFAPAAPLSDITVTPSHSHHFLTYGTYAPGEFSEHRAMPPCANLTEYYVSASLSAGGDALKSALNAAVSPHTVVSYAGAWAALRQLDAVPTDGSRVRLLYSSHTHGAAQTRHPIDYSWPHLCTSCVPCATSRRACRPRHSNRLEP